MPETSAATDRAPEPALGSGVAASRWLTTAPLLIAVAAGAITLDGGFVYDDQHAILGSPVVQGRVDVATGWLERDFWGLPLGGPAKVSWRPALPLIWRGLWAVGTGSPLPFRAFALLAHVVAVAAALTLTLALLRTRRRRPLGEAPGLPQLRAHDRVIAAIACSLFAVHPLQAEAVGALVGGADVLAFAAVAAALTHALQSSAPMALARAAALVGVGCLFKETALLGLPLLGLLAYCRRDSAAGWLAWSATALPVAALTLQMVARAHGGGTEQVSDNVLAALDPAQRLVLAFAIAWRGASDTVLPLQVAPNFSHGVYHADVAAFAGQALAGAAVAAAAAFVALRSLWRRDFAALCWVLLWAAPIVAVSNLLYVSPTEYAQRLLYGAVLPVSVGFAWLAWRAVARRWAGPGVGAEASALAAAKASAGGLAAAGIATAAAPREAAGIPTRAMVADGPLTVLASGSVARPWPARGVLWGLLVCLCVWALFAALRVRDQRPWHDQTALFTRAVEVVPESWRVQHNLGDALAKSGAMPEGVWHLLLGVHLQRRRPLPVDWAVIQALELEPARERLLLGPAALAGDEACVLIEALLRKAWPGPAFANDSKAMRVFFSERYACAAPAAEGRSAGGD